MGLKGNGYAQVSLLPRLVERNINLGKTLKSEGWNQVNKVVWQRRRGSCEMK